MAETRKVTITRQEFVKTEVEVELPAYFKWDAVEDHYTTECWIRVTADGRSLSLTATRHYNRPEGTRTEWEFSTVEGHLGDRISQHLGNMMTRRSTEDAFSRAVTTALHEISQAIGRPAEAAGEKAGQ